MTVAEQHAARRDAQHQRRLRRRPRRARRDASTCTPARSSAWSAATAPASRRSCACCPAPIPRTAARSSSTASRSASRTRATPRRYNIETIYQTLALADNIDAPANVFLGRELTTRLGTLDDSAMEDETRKVMARLNPNFTNFAQPVRSLSGGQRQAVAIARADLLQRQDPDHGRADGGARPGRDGAGARPRPPAQDGGHRHLPDQPRHPRRLRPVRPDQRHVPRPDRRQRSTRRTSRRTRSSA